MENRPLLTVCLITYNQVEYIRQSIDSVLAQKAEFVWNLVIADDCSADGTREILLEYQQRNPSLIHLILQEVNVGPAKNWSDLVDFPKSKFIAYLEGDDYWIDPFKLQKQIDILEKNQDINIVFTNVLVLENGNFEKYLSLDDRINSFDIHSQRDFFLMMKDWAPMLTCTFRRSEFAVSEMIRPVYNFPGDFQIIFLSLRTGKIHWLNDVMGVYRVHSESMSRTLMQQDRKRLKWEIFKYKYRFATSNGRWKTSFLLLNDYTRAVIRKSKYMGLFKRVLKRLGIKI